MKDKLQWVIADRDGDKREGAYETKVEAAVALERMRLAAVRTKNEAQARASEGRPWYTDDDNLKAVERFDARGWRVGKEALSCKVYRLNADIAQDSDFLREVLWKLRVCGQVEIDWTCIGRTRSEMQGASTAAFLSEYGYSAIVASGGDVVVSRLGRAHSPASENERLSQNICNSLRVEQPPSPFAQCAFNNG